MNLTSSSIDSHILQLQMRSALRALDYEERRKRVLERCARNLVAFRDFPLKIAHLRAATCRLEMQQRERLEQLLAAQRQSEQLRERAQEERRRRVEAMKQREQERLDAAHQRRAQLIEEQKVNKFFCPVRSKIRNRSRYA